jgi:hypothetical protein
MSTQILYQILSLGNHALTKTKLVDLIFRLLFYYRVDLLQPFLLFQLQPLAVLIHDAFIQSFLFFLQFQHESLILSYFYRAWFTFTHFIHFFTFYFFNSISHLLLFFHSLKFCFFIYLRFKFWLYLIKRCFFTI